MKKFNFRKFVGIALLVMLFVCIAGFTGTAEATGALGGTGGFPWEKPLNDLADSLTGPVAFALGLFMIVCGFCAVAFVGSELGGWVRWVAMAALLAGMLGAAGPILKLFGLTGAVIC